MAAERNKRLAMQEQKDIEDSRRRQEQFERERAERRERSRISDNEDKADRGKRDYDARMKKVSTVKAVVNNSEHKLESVDDAKKYIAFGWFVTASYTSSTIPFDEPVGYSEYNDEFVYKDGELLDIDVTEPIKITRASTGWKSPDGFKDAMQNIHNGKRYYYYGPFDNKNDALAFMNMITQQGSWIDYRIHKLSISGPINTSAAAATDIWGNTKEQPGSSKQQETQPASNNKTDFWGNPSHGKSAEEKAEQKSKPPGNSKTDFWGNPLHGTNSTNK
jgi:hypothetical protein